MRLCIYMCMYMPKILPPNAPKFKYQSAKSATFQFFSSPKPLKILPNLLALFVRIPPRKVGNRNPRLCANSSDVK